MINRSMNMIVNIIILTLSVLNIIGLIWLTKFSFSAEVVESGGFHVAYAKDISKNKLIFCKISVVSLWVSIALSALSTVWMMSGRKSL